MPLPRPRPTSALVLTLATLIGGCDADDTPTLQDSAVIARLQEHLDTLHAEGITGLLAEVDDGDERALARSGFARLDEAQPVPWDARFRMGSATKTFVAVVVLQLVGEGELALDDSVEKWLPGVVAGNGYDGTQITVRHLLQHTSGIFNYTNSIFSTFTPEIYQETRLDHHEPTELVAMALEHPPDFAPGTAWSYSNTNYILAGMIIERVTGRDWPTEVRARITEPLRLSSTSEPGDDPEVPGPHAQGYEQFSEGGALVDVTLLNHTFADAAGSLVTTTEDLARFLRALQEGQLLAPAELAEMQRTVLATPLQEIWPGVRYGLGIMQFPGSCGEAFWSHFGDTLGFSTRNAVSDDGSRVVVVSLSTNLAGPAVLGILAETQQLLDDAMCGSR